MDSRRFSVLPLTSPVATRVRGGPGSTVRTPADGLHPLVVFVVKSTYDHNLLVTHTPPLSPSGYSRVDPDAEPPPSPDCVTPATTPLRTSREPKTDGRGPLRRVLGPGLTRSGVTKGLAPGPTEVHRLRKKVWEFECDWGPRVGRVGPGRDPPGSRLLSSGVICPGMFTFQQSSDRHD